MWDKSGWRENIDVNVLNIRNMTTCDYMKPRPDSTFSSGNYLTLFTRAAAIRRIFGADSDSP